MDAYTETLERRLNGLLNDADVKSLPCYKVLREKYKVPLQPPAPKCFLKCACGILYKSWEKHVTSKKHMDYAAQAVEALESSVVETPAGALETPVGELETPVLEPPETLVSALETPADALEPPESPFPTDPVYRVSIKGKIYLNKNEALYDGDTRKKVGHIGPSGFVLNGKIIPIKTRINAVPVPDYEQSTDYCSDGEKIYRKIGTHVAHAIGIYANQQVELWEDT
jgi:hypothetical protein